MLLKCHVMMLYYSLYELHYFPIYICLFQLLLLIMMCKNEGVGCAPNAVMTHPTPYVCCAATFAPSCINSHKVLGLWWCVQAGVWTKGVHCSV